MTSGFCKLVVLILSLSLLSVNSYGQSKFAAARAELSSSVAKIGDRGELKVILQIPEKAHVNSATPSDPNLIATVFSPDPVVGVTWESPIYPPEIEVTEWYSVDPLKVYGDGATITVPFLVNKNAKGTIKISGSLISQACDDEKCYPPKKAVVSIDLQVSPENQSGTPAVVTEKSTIPGHTTSVSNDEAIEFAFTDFDGNSRKLSDFRGKIVFLDFWATWCKPCLADFPKLKDLYAKYQSSGFEMIGLQAETLGDEEADSASIAEGLERGKNTVKRFSANWIMAEPKSSLNVATKILKVDVLPTKVLLGKDGKILRMVTAKDDLAGILSEVFAKK